MSSGMRKEGSRNKSSHHSNRRNLVDVRRVEEISDFLGTDQGRDHRSSDQLVLHKDLLLLRPQSSGPQDLEVHTNNRDTPIFDLRVASPVWTEDETKTAMFLVQDSPLHDERRHHSYDSPKFQYYVHRVPVTSKTRSFRSETHVKEKHTYPPEHGKDRETEKKRGRDRERNTHRARQEQETVEGCVRQRWRRDWGRERNKDREKELTGIKY